MRIRIHSLHFIYNKLHSTVDSIFVSHTWMKQTSFCRHQIAHLMLSHCVLTMLPLYAINRHRFDSETCKVAHTHTRKHDLHVIRVMLNMGKKSDYISVCIKWSARNFSATEFVMHILFNCLYDSCDLLDIANSLLIPFESHRSFAFDVDENIANFIDEQKKICVEMRSFDYKPEIIQAVVSLSFSFYIRFFFILFFFSCVWRIEFGDWQ